MSTLDIGLRSDSQRGLTLIELVMFIVIVSVAVTGVLSVMSYTTSKSADPMVQKQAIAVAESLLEEIQAKPFTFCDPNDANVSTANAPVAGQCTIVEAIGAETGQTRTDLATPFNNVNDYHGYTMPLSTGILDVAGVSIPALKNYSAAVTVVEEQVEVGGVPNTESLRIDVRVQGPSGVDVTLTGYRMRYAPNVP